MDDTLSDILQCEEQLRITLHCDDKEKLRRKLLYLQKEYQRTAKRLQRAERSEAVQRCVRSQVTQQHPQKDQGQQEARPSPSDDPCLQSLTTTNAPDVPHQCKGHAGGSEKSRGQVLRFLLPLEAACPQTPSSVHESATDHRPSPALRLRSRRSRLRWERQSSVVGVSTDSSQDGQEQTERTEPAPTPTAKGDETKPTGARHVEEQTAREGPEQRDREIKVTVEAHKESQPSLPAWKCSIQTEETEQVGTQSHRKKAKLEQSEDGRMEKVDKLVEDGRECEKGGNENTVKEENLNMDGAECDIKGVGLLDSCTLVEGLLFPAEYYIRTTRRMASSQSQPDMQAVILSQLNAGRCRRGRGSGRRLAPSGGSPEAQVSAETTGQSSCKNSGHIPACQLSKKKCPADVSAPRPARGRKRKRGRGRARPNPSPDTGPPGCEPTSDTPQLTNSPLLLSPLPHATTVWPLSLCAAEEPKSHLTGPEPDDRQLPVTPSTGAEHQAGGGAGTNDDPNFLKKSSGNSRSSQLTASQPLAVPSPPAPTSLPPPSLSLSSFVRNLSKFDVQQDFHLPDDQFASLKLHKLRQVAVETGLESFSSPSYCTRRSVWRYALSPGGGDVATPLPVPSGSTPTVPSSPDTAEVKHDFTAPVDDPNTPELSEQEKDEGPGTQNSTESGSEDGGSAADRVGGCKAGLTDCPEENQGLSNHTDARADSGPGSVLRPESPAKETKESSEATTSPGIDGKNQKASLQSRLLSSPLVSGLLTTPQPPSSSLTSSPSLPSLGVTPQRVPAALPLTSSPSAPTLVPPPPHSPSTQALSPPPLSPCPSPPLAHTTGPANGPQADGKTEEAEEELKSCTHTLKTPSGGCLVDACCLPGSSGRLCVAAAGKWAVCLWTQSSASAWNLTHTWSFNEMVINVFAVPDAAGLICVTLGQLEIREVRILSCSSRSQASLCGGSVQTVVGVSKSRVVTLSHSASGSDLWAFTLSDSGSTLSSRPLVSPGVCVGALSPVQGLPDALIGTDDNQRLFIWNLNTGQLLQKVHLGGGLPHSACLRGYSCCGVLFVLLQHQFLSSHEEGEGEVPVKERKTTGLLSLVAINPVSGKSVLATRLHPPAAWSGRLCDVDVHGGSVVGLSQNGCVCVWELGRSGASRTVGAPESEGWQLARWGGPGTLLTGHHNGDVTLHCGRSPE